MSKRISNFKQLLNFIKYSKTDEQSDLIKQVIEHYSSGKIHKVVTAENMINKILSTKTSRESVAKQLPKLETKEPVNKIIVKTESKLNQFLTIKEQSCVLDGLTCVEFPDVGVLDKLLNSDLLNTRSYTKKDFFGTSPKYENERKHLESYRMSVDRDGKVKVKYEKHSAIKYGRVYCKDYIGAILIRQKLRGKQV